MSMTHLVKEKKLYKKVRKWKKVNLKRRKKVLLDKPATKNIHIEKKKKYKVNFSCTLFNTSWVPGVVR